MFILFFSQDVWSCILFWISEKSTHATFVNRSTATYIIRLQFSGSISQNGVDIWALVRKTCQIRAVAFRYYVSVYDQLWAMCILPINNTRGALPRRADARVGFAHARNYQGCRQIEAVNTTQPYCQGVHQKEIEEIALNEQEKENTGIRCNEAATNVTIRHTMTSSSSK